RKLVQALTVGTPAVSTRVGVEGLDLGDSEGVLIADEPDAFARAVVRLLHDEELWQRLARRGRERVVRSHGREVAREQFLRALDAVLSRPPKLPPEESPPDRPSPAEKTREYALLVRRV